MKTILYNPIFINPQAYYVFPQLYNIQKGDSFIEPAVYSGYLLIEDLISNTSSQVTDTREVDFTQFAGRRIRISQYTNIGAVVLGEWLLLEELKEFDKDWESRRTNIDGTEALIHEEIFNEYFPPVMLLSETDEDTTAEYPFPLLDEEDITNSPEWSNPEQEII